MAFLIVAIAVLVAIGASVVVAWRRTAHGLAAAKAEVATERSRLADALESERRAAAGLDRALDAIPDAVIVVDAQGRRVHANAAADSLEDARHSDALVAAAVDELLTEALAGERGRRELDLYGPPRRHLIVTATPLFADDRLDGAIARIGDETERMRVDAMRRDFVANVSHELKTPVGAISLLSEAILDEDDPEVAQRLLTRVFEESNRLTRTIEDLIELSRIEGEELLETESLEVALVVSDACARVTSAAERSRSSIQIAIPDGMRIDGDRRQLASALANLLDNALKYSEPESVVELWARAEGDEAVLAVRDHGIGIPSRDLERIFERFYRVDHARSRQTGGTGLGLAIVRHVVANHGGTVGVESRLGEGTTFTLRLPGVLDPGAPRHLEVAS